MANIVSTSGIAGWSTTEASNQPDSADSATIQGDLRAIQSAVRYLYSSDTIASANTCDLGSKAAENLTVSGVTTITSLGSTGVAGQLKNVYFSGALTLTHNGTSLILPTGANITTVAGDTAVFLCEGSGNWRCLSYSGKSGQFLSGNFTDTTDSSSSTTGALKTAGGMGIDKKLYVGDKVSISQSNNNFTLDETSSFTGSGPQASKYYNPATTTNGEPLSRNYMYGNNSTPAKYEYARYEFFIDDKTAGSEDASYKIKLATAGTLTDALTVTGTYVSIPSGIKFPATQVPSSDANTLDDYEEGVLGAIGLVDTNGAITANTSASTGKYVKIGKLVHFELNLTITTVTTSGGSGAVYFTGAPFTPDATAPAALAVGEVTGFATNFPTCSRVSAGGIYLFYGSGTGTGVSQIARTNLAAGAVMKISGTYTATA